MDGITRLLSTPLYAACLRCILLHFQSKHTITGELGYDGPLYDGFLHITDDMLGPSPMHIKYSSYVYDRFCI